MIVVLKEKIKPTIRIKGIATNELVIFEMTIKSGPISNMLPRIHRPRRFNLLSNLIITIEPIT